MMTSSVRQLATLAGTFLSVAMQAMPANNPITDHYAGDPHLEDYHWTDQLAWANVHNFLDYGAVADGNAAGDGVGVTDNLGAFNAAVAALYQQGGGVLFIPAGVYFFSDDLYLRNGVILRGETPLLTDAQNPGFAPPSRLEFPMYRFDPTANGGAGVANTTAFKFIRVLDNDFAGQLGVVWLDINRAGISLAADSEGSADRIVFGTRTNNVAAPDPQIPILRRTVSGVERDFQHAWQRYSHRFARNIHVLAERNVLVANNRCNDMHFIVDHQLSGWENVEIDDFIQPGYIIQDTKRAFGSDTTAFVALEERNLPVFSYTNHYGIYVRGSAGSIWGAAPFQTPSLFLAGITVRDNWVYTTMRVGYHLSGYGLKVLNNIKQDRANKVWWIHPTGRESLQGATTLENRGIDIAGSRILVDGNQITVYRHRVNNGSYLSTDGEGILVQECCGGTTLDDVVISNNTTNTYVGLYKMPYLRNIKVTDNTFTDGAFLMIDANKNGTQAPVFNVQVSGNVFTSSGGINVTGKSGGNGIIITDNILSGGNISYPATISTVSGNSGFGTLNPRTEGTVRDYPIVEIDNPAINGILQPGPVRLKVRVVGSHLNPQPADPASLPAIRQLDLYVNAVLLQSFTTMNLDPETTAWIYETDWFPAPGHYQLSARAIPGGYAGPSGSTEWFTVSMPIHLQVGDNSPVDPYPLWRAAHFSSADPHSGDDAFDVDGDGVPNLVEFLTGTHPANANSSAAPYLLQTEDSRTFRLRIINDPGAKVFYRIFQSGDLQNWSKVPRTALTGRSALTDEPGVMEYQYQLPQTLHTPAFLRLEVRRKP